MVRHHFSHQEKRTLVTVKNACPKSVSEVLVRYFSVKPAHFKQENYLKNIGSRI